MRISFSFRRYIWSAVTLAALAVAMWFSWQVIASCRTEGMLALEQGRRVVVDVATGAVVMRPEPPEEAEIQGPPPPPPQGEMHDVPLPRYEGVSVAILFTGLGLNREVSESGLALPQQVGLSFSPYAPEIKSLAERARQSGHEIFLDLPVEPEDYPLTDSGPNTLLVRSSKAKNMFRFDNTVSAAEDIRGVFVAPGEVFTNALTSVLPLLDEMKKRNLLFIYRENPQNAFLFNETKAVGVQAVKEYYMIDGVPSPEAVTRALSEAKKRAVERKATVLMVAQPYPATVIKITEFISQLRAEGIELAPVSNAIDSGAAAAKEEDSGEHSDESGESVH